MTWDVCKLKKRGLLIKYCLRLLVIWVPSFRKENMALQCPESYNRLPTNEKHTGLCVLQFGNVNLLNSSSQQRKTTFRLGSDIVIFFLLYKDTL